jgi:uncharacterized protein YcbK (DUF882 family)
MGDLSRNFSRTEFACRCGCGEDRIHPDLIATLQRARDIYSKSMTITSGVRCLDHNRAEGGSPTSSHLPKARATDDPRTFGVAIDVSVSGGAQRFQVADALIRAGFRRLGPAHRFIHADIDPEKQIPSLFTYDRPKG